MKKIVSIILCVALIAVCLTAFAACNTSNDDDSAVKIAFVTDVGQLMDGSFNQGTWEGTKAYAEANNMTYAYYQPANGSDATDNDRIAAMRLAVENGAEVVICAGFLQAGALSTVAAENPSVKFVFVDGWALGLDNVTAIIYKEQESGYFAGYAAVMDGYRNLGAALGGGGTNPACCRYGYGYLQGIVAAAKELNVSVNVDYSFQYGSSFEASTNLQTQMASWYAKGTEIIFSCGGSMLQSVKAAAVETENGKIIGVDVDQVGESDRIVTSAMKGLAVSVEKVLGQIYSNQWASLSNAVQNLGVDDNATGIPTADASWKFENFTKAQYQAVFDAVKAGTIVIDDASDVATQGKINDYLVAAGADSLVTVTVYAEIQAA